MASSGLAQRELLGGGAVAGVDLELGAVGGVVARIVEAEARLRIEQRAVGLLLPDLAADPVAVPQLHLGADRGAVAVDVEAAAEGLKRAVGVVVPVLVDRVGLAPPELYEGTVPAGVIARDVNALGAGPVDHAAAVDREHLGGGPVAGVDLQHGAVGGVTARIVEAQPRLGIEQRPVGLLHPFLAADAVAVPQLHLGADRGAVPVDVEAAAEGAERVVGVVGPVLVDRVRLAVPEVHHRPVGPRVVADDVDALAAGAADRAGGGGRPVGVAAVVGGDDAGLHGVVGRVGREAGRHHALEERADRRVAVVAAGAEHDRAFLVHRRVAAGQRPVPVGRQAAGLGVAAPKLEGGLPVVLQHRGDEVAVARRVIGVTAVPAHVLAVLHVGLDPGAATRARREAAVRGEVDRVHVGGAVVAGVGLGVAEVEPAAGVHVGAAGHHVHALGLAVDRDAGGA